MFLTTTKLQAAGRQRLFLTLMSSRAEYTAFVSSQHWIDSSIHQASIIKHLLYTMLNTSAMLLLQNTTWHDHCSYTT